MCGVVALLTPNPDFDQRVLDRMRDRLAHRGPDGAETWIARKSWGAVGLAHRRLAIIDRTPGGQQPMFAQDGRVAIVYNGEIYNYIELRAELKQLGVSFQSDSDTEVLLQTYLMWGYDCLQRLNGMFAFAIYDARTETLFAARDRFGEKPLFFALPDGGGLAIASEAKALLAHPGVAASIEQSTFDGFLRGTYSDQGSTTLFQGISRLEAATAFIANRHGKIERQWRFWTPDYKNVDNTITFADAKEQYASLLRRSVKMRLRSDAQLGACLSGGLDSSSIVCLIAEEADIDTVKMYSVRFDDDATISEGPYIDNVLRHCSVAGDTLSPTAGDLVADWRDLHWFNETPMYSASIYNQFALMRRVRETGTTVILDGQGADEVLGGYQYYFALRQLDLLETRRDDELELETSLFNYRLARTANRYVDVTRRFNPNQALPLDYLFQRRANRESIGDIPNRPGIPSTRAGQLFRRQLAVGLLYDQLPNQLAAADRNGMAFGCEARFPFLDYDFVDWCIKLPDNMLIQNGWLKFISRHAMCGVVPRAVLLRPDKVGFAAPQDVWLRGPWTEWARELLFHGPITEWPGYDRSHLEKQWQQHAAGDVDRSGELFKWMSASEWLRMVADLCASNRKEERGRGRVATLANRRGA